MKILFITEKFDSGSPMMRCVQPCEWINKFTEHEARVIDSYCAALQSFRHLLDWADIIVVHKQHDVMLRWAKLAKKAGKVLVFETDDYDRGGFDNFYNGHYLLGFFENYQPILDLADGVICGSEPLRDRVQHDVKCVVPNGFDLTLPVFNITPKEYYSSPAGESYKIAWGGGTSHGRDFNWFFQSGVIERLNEEFDIDWYFYGLAKWQSIQRPYGKGRLITANGTDIEKYLNNLFSDSTLLIAPLVQDEFNGCRSTLKLVEAGFAGKTIVASKTLSYETYNGLDGVVLCDNDSDQWYSALRELILNKGLRLEKEQANRDAAYMHYTAEKLTQRRIDFFTQLLGS